jgi:hypothetical protein
VCVSYRPHASLTEGGRRGATVKVTGPERRQSTCKGLGIGLGAVTAGQTCQDAPTQQTTHQPSGGLDSPDGPPPLLVLKSR